VGETTVAVNLALALHRQSRRVGPIDTDLYGPDVPRMFGLRRRAEANQISVQAAPLQPHSRLDKLNRYGVDLVSAAFLLGEDQAVAVEAPIAQLLVLPLFSDVDWSDVDCLVVDLPPGTADIRQAVLGLRRRSPQYVRFVPEAWVNEGPGLLIATVSGRPGASAGGGWDLGAGWRTRPCSMDGCAPGPAE
jgi:hypothetical protein